MRILFVLSLMGVWSVAGAAPPPEVTGVGFQDRTTLSWSGLPQAATYNIYYAALAELAPGYGGRCLGHAVPVTSFSSAAEPAPGLGFFYLVTGESGTVEEGSAGTSSALALRKQDGRCTPVMRAHVLDRTGFGKDEWAASRIAALGLAGYINEQLDPASIDDASNSALQTRLAGIQPPDDIYDLLALQVVRAVYSRRQLEQETAAFWANHFNTDWSKVAELYQGAFPDCTTGLPQCDPYYPERAYREASRAQFLETESFRYLAFGGTFRQILEASAKSPAMMIYLDTLSNQAPVANENYARELLELHAMGVDGGYTQTDVQELARVFTGWTLCKKETAQVNDPLAPCLTYWEALPPGRIVATFVDSLHDCASKTLFVGTAQQVVLPSTCAAPPAGVGELETALDALAAHPSTKRYISKKILQQFVTDEPTTEMIDALVATWNNPANPHGIGDLREVLEAALSLPEFLDPTRTRSKIKTPLEQFASAFRAIRGTTDGQGYAINYLASAQHLPHFNPIPTGYEETGAFWIDTTNTLTRQNFSLHLAATSPGLFGSDPIGLLHDNSVSTANGNAAAIIDFLAEYLFAGRLTQADRAAALFYLTTDNVGSPAPYDDYKVRKTVGLMLGFAQFQEQ